MKRKKSFSLLLSSIMMFVMVFAMNTIAKAEGTNIPVLNGISVDRQVVDRGYVLNLSAMASTTEGTLAEKANVCYIQNNVEKEIELSLINGKYEGQIQVNDSFAFGLWQVSFVALEDTAGNASIVYNSKVHRGVGQDLSAADFMVTVQDNTNPSFVSVNVNSQEAKLGEEVKVTVTATDDLSGLAKEANLSYVQNLNGVQTEKEVALTLVDGKYEGSLQIDNTFTTGLFQVNFITMEDNAGNAIIVYNSKVNEGLGQDLSSGDFYASAEESAAPQFTGVTVDQKEVGLNGKVTITVTAVDDYSGLAEEANVCYVKEVNGMLQEREVALQLVEGKYVGTINIAEKDVDGIEQISFITLEDKAGNATIVYNSKIHAGIGVDLSAGNFTVITADEVAPSFLAVTVDKNVAGLGETVTITVDAKDEVSGLAEEANLSYIQEIDGVEVEKEVTLKLVDGRYVGQFFVDESVANGTFRISFITLEDKTGNATIVYNSNIHQGIGQDLNSGNFTVNTANTITIEVKEQVVQGSAAKITVLAKNNSLMDKKATLVVGLYTESGKFINYIAVEQVVKAGQTAELSGLLKLLPEGSVVKCFVWDTLEDMNPLTDVIVIPVR